MFELMTWPRNAWSIFDELESMHDGVNRTLGRRLTAQTGRRGSRYSGGTTYPLMNVWSSENGIVIDVELPGVDPKDVDISVMGDELTLSGKVNVQEPSGEVTSHRRERPTGEFSRSLQLPFRANAGAVKANYRNGVLRLTIPRSEEEKPRKIAVDAA